MATLGMPLFVFMKKQFEKVIDLKKDPIFRRAVEYKDEFNYAPIAHLPPEINDEDDDDDKSATAS